MHSFIYSFIYSFIHPFILRFYMAPLQEGNCQKERLIERTT